MKYFTKKIKSLDDLNQQFAELRLQYRLPEGERGVKRENISCVDPGNTPWCWAGEKLSPEATEINDEYLLLYSDLTGR